MQRIEFCFYCFPALILDVNKWSIGKEKALEE